MSSTATQTERREQVEEGPESNVLEMTRLITERLSYFRRIAMRRLNSMADAEDAVQDALLAAWQHRDQFRGEARISTWLTTIVINSSRQIVRKRSRRHLIPIDDQEDGESTAAPFSEILPDRRPDPEAQFRNSEDARRLQYLLSRLPPKLRLIIQMVSVEGLSVREVAEALDISQTAVKSRAARARAELRRLDRTHHADLYVPPDPRGSKPVDPLRRSSIKLAGKIHSASRSCRGIPESESDPTLMPESGPRLNNNALVLSVAPSRGGTSYAEKQQTDATQPPSE